MERKTRKEIFIYLLKKAIEDESLSPKELRERLWEIIDAFDEMEEECQD